MSDKKVNPQVRPEVTIRKINGLAQGVGGTSSRSVGLVEMYASLPDASDLPNGLIAYDLSAGKLQITVSGSWSDVHI